jgi:hypothetical protein
MTDWLKQAEEALDRLYKARSHGKKVSLEHQVSILDAALMLLVSHCRDQANSPPQPPMEEKIDRGCMDEFIRKHVGHDVRELNRYLACWTCRAVSVPAPEEKR